MYWLRLYELKALSTGHPLAAEYFIVGKWYDYVGPGFLNAVNRYYMDQIWR